MCLSLMGEGMGRDYHSRSLNVRGASLADGNDSDFMQLQDQMTRDLLMKDALICAMVKSQKLGRFGQFAMYDIGPSWLFPQ